MRMRRILLVHPTRSIRALIKKYVFAELSDVEFVEAENGASALAELNKTPFDMLVATSDMQDVSAVELKIKIAETGHNAATPCIILSEDENGNDLRALTEQGFEHVVQIRVRPADLIRKINAVCNPRLWRKDQRFYIPKTKVILSMGRELAEGSLINISKGGVLLAMITVAPELLMKANISLAVRIPGPTSVYEIGGLPCKLSRLNITEWQPNYSPAAMRVTMIFLDLTEEQDNQIEQVLQLAVEDKLNHDDDN